MQEYADIYLLRLQFLVLLMMGAVTPETCRVTLLTYLLTYSMVQSPS
jgi:hypothetical protein